MKTCKKLLAVTIALVLLVSTFVSGLVVSAAEPYSVTIADTEITAGEDATVKVTVDFKGDALDALHMLATVDTTLAIADAAIVSVDYADDYKDPGDSELEVPALRIKNDGKNLEAGKILFESGVDGAVKAKQVVFALTFEDVAEGTYPIAINVEFTNYAEGEFPALTDEAEIVVNPAHVCEGTVLSDNGNGTHDVKCKCGEVVTAGVACEYVDGFCACGAKKEIDTALNISFSAKTLSLKSAISINYYVAAKDFDGYDSFFVRVSQELDDGTYRTEELEGTYSPSYGGEYLFAYTGVAAKEMNDKVMATICAMKDDIVYESEPEEYGVYTYAYNQLAKTTASATLKVAMVDMLNYGAAAQVYLGYNVDNLVNAKLTAEQKALGTTTIPAMENNRNLGATTETLTVKHTSPAISLKSAVGITYYCKVSGYTGDVNNLSLVLDYAEDAEPIVVPFAEMESSGSEYRYAFYNISARQMRNVCKFVWYENYGTDSQKAVSDTMTYSIESYAQGKYGGTDVNLSNLVLEMMRYSDSVSAFLG